MSEFGAAAAGDRLDRHRVHLGQRRRVRAYPDGEFSKSITRAFDFDDDAGAGVENLTGQAEIAGQGVDERTESHALDHTEHRESVTGARTGCRRVR